MIVEQFQLLSENYAKDYPKEEPIESYINAFGFEGLIDILKEADGRLIVFTESEVNDDEVSYTYG